jgi:sialic acid synthase SpsE
MSTTASILGKLVGEGQPTFMIAEAGINHNGNLDLAKQLAREAAQAGADAVKFQSFSPTDLMIESAASAVHLDLGAGEESVYDFIRRISMDRAQHDAMKREAESAGTAFFSSVFSPEMLAMLEDMGVESYKIASMDLDNTPLLAEVAKTGKSIVVSTGMGSLAEVDTAMETLVRNGAGDIVLLHCVSEYPASPDKVNLKTMDVLAAAFGVPIGFSVHTVGVSVALAAVARGAAMIEKHFTVDTTLPGPDQALSADTAGLTRLVNAIRDVEAALGSARKRPTEGEIGMRSAMRRSIVTGRAISAGTVLRAEDLTAKRPGEGISPGMQHQIVGRKMAVDIEADEILTFEHLV